MKLSQRSYAPWPRLSPAELDAGGAWRRVFLGSSCAVCADTLELSQWRPWLTRLPERLQSKAARPIRPAQLFTTGRTTFQLRGPDRRPLVVKCYPEREAAASLSPMRPKRSRHPWEAFACHLELWWQGVPVPEPLAYLQGPAGSDPAYFVITRRLERCQPLLDFAFEHFCRQGQPWSQHHDWGRAVLNAILRLHQAGYAHGDLGHHNILVRRWRCGAGLQVFLTDFDSCTSAAGPALRRAQLRDLATLGVTLYQVVPERTLGQMLAFYLRRLGLKRAVRSRCRAMVANTYGQALKQYLACFRQMEACYFDQAERTLRHAAMTP